MSERVVHFVCPKGGEPTVASTTLTLEPDGAYVGECPYDPNCNDPNVARCAIICFGDEDCYVGCVNFLQVTPSA